MSIIDKKRKIFGEIAALRTLTDNFPKLKLSSSLSSVNNKGNSISFLSDLLTLLIGYDVLVTSVVDILTFSLKEIENEIKIALKEEIKGIVSCGINPTIPNFVKTPGIVIEVSKIDFLDLLKTNPNTTGGKLIYNDITSPTTNSDDFNTFLYGVIQDDGVTHSWKNIFDITFNSNGNGVIPNNTLTIKSNSSYNNKTLTDLNNDFIDSITLFNTENIVNKIIDLLYGTVSISNNKSTKQLENEAKINTIIDSLVNSDYDDVIDDSYFTFNNVEVYKQQEEANTRKNGILKLECCNKTLASIPVDFLTNFTNEMSTVSNLVEKKTVLSSNLDKIANQNTLNSIDKTDNISIKLNFIQQLLNNLIKSIIWEILSPKVISIFLINYKIVNGQDGEFNDPIDFIKKNKNLFVNLMKRISGMIIEKLIAIATKKIFELVGEAAAKKEIEKSKSQLSQILSLVGVQQDVLRLIQGLS